MAGGRETARIATVSSSGLRIFRVDELKELRPVSHSTIPGALCVSWNHTNQVLAVGGSSDNIHLVQAEDGEILSVIPFDEEDSFQGPVRCLAFSVNSRYLASSAGSTINLWDLKRRQLKATFGGHLQDVTCLSISAEGDIVSGDASGAVRIWDIMSGSSSEEIVRNGRPAASVERIAVSRTGLPRIAIGYSDGFVDIRDYQTHRSIWQTLAHGSGRVTDVSFSTKNPSLVLTSGSDGNVNLFDSQSSSPLGIIALGESFPTAISQSNDGFFIVVGTNSGSVLYYNWANAKEPYFVVPESEAHAGQTVSAVQYESVPLPKTAVSTPKRSKSGVKSPSRGGIGGKSKAEREPLSVLQTSTGSLGSTLSSLSASTDRVGAQMQIQRQKTILERVEKVRETLYTNEDDLSSTVASKPLSEATTPPRSPPRSPPRPGAALSARSKTGAEVIAYRQQGLEESRTLLSTVAAQMDSVQKENATGKIEDDLPAEDSVVALPPPPNSPPERGVGNASVSEVSDADTAQETKATGASSRYSSAYVDSLIKSRLSHRDRQPHQPQQEASASHKSPNTGRVETGGEAEMKDKEVEQIRHGVEAVTSQEMQEALQLLKYDIHKDVWSILTEQARQFELQRGDMLKIVEELKGHLSSVLEANMELRKENERLRHIY